MSVWKAEVRVWYKPSVFDPQGNAVEHALSTLGFEGVDEVRIGRTMQLRVEASNESAARDKVDAICNQVLCNPVMETYSFELEPVEAGATV